jgi:hypothetical protein
MFCHVCSFAPTLVYCAEKDTVCAYLEKIPCGDGSEAHDCVALILAPQLHRVLDVAVSQHCRRQCLRLQAHLKNTENKQRAHVRIY